MLITLFLNGMIAESRCCVIQYPGARQLIRRCPPLRTLHTLRFIIWYRTLREARAFASEAAMEVCQAEP